MSLQYKNYLKFSLFSSEISQETLNTLTNYKLRIEFNNKFYETEKITIPIKEFKGGKYFYFEIPFSLEQNYFIIMKIISTSWMLFNTIISEQKINFNENFSNFNDQKYFLNFKDENNNIIVKILISLWCDFSYNNNNNSNNSNSSFNNNNYNSFYKNNSIESNINNNNLNNNNNNNNLNKTYNKILGDISSYDFVTNLNNTVISNKNNNNNVHHNYNNSKVSNNSSNNNNNNTNILPQNLNKNNSFSPHSERVNISNIFSNNNLNFNNNNNISKSEEILNLIENYIANNPGVIEQDL